MTDFNYEQLQNILEIYVIPWGINIFFALLIFVIGRIVVNTITKLVGKVLRKAELDDILVDFISDILKFIGTLIVIITALSKLGIETTSLVAVLGAAGLAIGLSLQGSLQNFAAGVMLLVFRPFKKGDYIDAGGAQGSVESIRIFITTIKSVDNKEIIIPNGNIYGNNIINFSARPTRRVDMVFSIGYECDLKKAKEILKDIVESDERILKDPEYTIAVGELTDSSVNFVVRPWVKSEDYWGVYFDMHETVKLRFDEEGISIP